MTHGMLSRWDNYVTMNDHDGWCMVDGYCTMGIIQNIGREVGEVINVFGVYGGLVFYCKVTSLELPPHGTNR
jgi:hypothetical protein